MFTAYDARLEVLSGGKPLPASAKMPKEYSGVDRLFVMSPRGSVLKTERYNITAMAFTKAPLGSVELYTKAMGETVVGWAPPKKLVQVPGRSVWEISLPPSVRYKMHSFRLARVFSVQLTVCLDSKIVDRYSQTASV
jgi:hypothetical protein